MENILNSNNPSIVSNEAIKPNSDILKTLRQVSLIFFLLLGITHLITGLLVSQNLFLPTTNLINKVLDIPFAVISTVYGLSNIHLSANNSHKKLYLGLMIAISLAVLAILLYINLLIPDRIS